MHTNTVFFALNYLYHLHVLGKLMNNENLMQCLISYIPMSNTQTKNDHMHNMRIINHLINYS